MSWFHRLTNLFRSEKLSSEIHDELNFHLQARTRDNLANGMTLSEAREDAARRFGGRLIATENSRDADVLTWLDTIAQDVRYAFRSMRKNPWVTSVALLSLALAIGANTAIFSVVNAVLLRSLPYKDADRIAIVRGASRNNSAHESYISNPNFDDYKTRNHSFEELAGYRTTEAPFNEKSGADTEWIGYAAVSGNFFRTLGRAAVAGRVFNETEFAEGARTAVISQALWKNRFAGSADALGRFANVAGVDFQIIGVMPEDFSFPSKKTQLWILGSAHPQWQSRHTRRDTGFWAVFGRLKPITTAVEAQREMRGLAAQLDRQYDPADNEDTTVDVIPLNLQINGKAVPFMLAVLFGAVFFVLLIACANVANLQLARGATRAREMALRTALGAGRIRIVRQLLTESVLLSAVAGVLSLPLVAWGIRALIALAPPGIARLDEVRIDGAVLGFALLLSLIAGVLFGLAPAIRISENITSKQSAGGLHAGSLRAALAIAEFACAVVLLSGAGLMIRSFLAVQAVDTGFVAQNVITARLRFRNELPDAQRVSRFQRVLKGLAQVPGVQSVGAVNTMFWNDDVGQFGLRAVQGRPAERTDRRSSMTWSKVSGDYFQALGVPLLAGRWFSVRDNVDAPPVVIVNEAMAHRFWPGETAVGRRIKGFDARGRNDEWVTVIGVVKDVHSRGVEKAPMAQIFETQLQALEDTQNVVVRTTLAPAQAAAAIRTALRSLDSTAVWSDMITLEDRLKEQSAPRRFQTWVLSLFAGIALALAGIGIFGMMHYSVAQRTQEIGIRMALGARVGNVLTMIIREGLVLVGAGVALGIMGSLLLMRGLSSLLFGVRPSDPLTLLSVSGLLTVIALLACYIPARRATRIDPMRALRCE